jgi:hypothetical protein
MRFKSAAQRKAVMASLNVRRPIVKLHRSLGRNLEMNPETYKLRRKVIDIIYDIKRIVPDLPRINVRIFTSENEKRLGIANIRPGEYVIWIPDFAIKKENDAILRHIVFHEVAHTVYDAPHNEKCRLMHPEVNRINPLTEDELHERINYYRNRKIKW